MNRRDFLQPHRLANLAGPMLGSVADQEAPPSSSSTPVMLRFSRRAMATTFEVILPFTAPGAQESAEAALDEIDRLEAQLTVYRATSEVSRLNAAACHHPVRVESNLFELFLQAERIHRDTDGAFDVAVGALIKTWGFQRRAGRVPTAEELAAVRTRIGMHHVRLDAQRQTVFFQQRGVEINLGSIGKGYALDRAANLANAENILIHGGHSSILARGNETPDALGWTVGLTDPEQPQCRRAFVHLRNRAMATSAATHQYFVHDGKKLGHLLDPRTAWPAEHMLSVTATAPSAAEADALATAFFILGIERAHAFCEQHPDIGAVLITANCPQRLVLLGHAQAEVQVLR